MACAFCFEGCQAPRVEITATDRGVSNDEAYPMSCFLQVCTWQIPDTVWGALAGSILTLTGVFLTNWNSRKQLGMQLEHSARQEDRKRYMDLRRDVYLPAAEAIMRSNGVISKLVDLSVSENDVAQTIQESFAILAKMHVVGKERTVAAVIAYQAGSSRRDFLVYSCGEWS
jgi:hypothetical protein